MSTTNQLIPFEFENHEVRIVMQGDKPWAVAKDLAEAMDYTWAGIRTVQHIPEKWRGVESVSTPQGVQRMHILSEEGWYFFVARSDKPKAIPFQEWLAGVVLPSIRKTGTYSVRSENDLKMGDLLSMLYDDAKHWREMYENKGKALRYDERWTINRLHQEGLSVSEISCRVHRSESLIREKLGVV